MIGDPRVEVPAFKRLLRATGVNPGNAFFFRRPFSTDHHEKNNETSPWCNYAVNTRDTLATCEIETEDYFWENSPALICLRVRPAKPGVSFPTSCIISLSTSSQRMDELAVQDVVVKEWNMNPAKLSNSGWMETTISVKTVYHIACLIGKEPTSGTRIFLTLRFVGCCDMSDTHRIAAVELLYTSLRPLVLPTQRINSVNLDPTTESAAIGVGPILETVEVELTLSPTPLRVVDDKLSEEGFSEYASRSPFLIQHSRERVLASEKEFLLNEGAPPIPLRPPLLRSQPCSPDSNKDRSYDCSEDCVLAEYAVHTPTVSPPRRSKTQPRRTIYVDANDDDDDDDDDISSDVVEVQASPCLMPSNSSSLHCLQGTTMLESDVVSDVPILVSSATPPKGMQFNENFAPRREVPVISESAVFSTNTTTSTTNTNNVAALHKDVFSLERSWDHQHEKLMNETIEDKSKGSIRMTPSVPLLCQIPLVVPDRRDFVPVSSLQRPKQNGPYSNWGELDSYTNTTCRVPVIEVEPAVVEESRRRIRNLRDVPVYEEQQDLLKTVTELLGVERTSLCKGSFSRTSSTVPSRVISTQPSVTGPQRSPSPCCTVSTTKDSRQRLVSVEIQESHSSVSEPTPTPTLTPTPSLEITKLPEESKQNTKNTEGISQSSINRVFRVPPTAELGANEVKKDNLLLNQYSVVLPKPAPPPPPMEALRPLKNGKGRHFTRQPLADRTSDINLNVQNSKVTSVGKCTVWKKPDNSIMEPLPYDTTVVSSSEESDEPSLVVQVEESTSTNVPAYWGNSIDVSNTHIGGSLTTTTPFIGTFLVWKHHVSRNGVAKRILSLQRDGDAVLLSLKKLDYNKKVSQVRLQEKIEFITGLRAYHSNAIHRGSVHVAEWCLVITCDGRQVAALEMQSLSELNLAVQILHPLCPSSPA
ncbi:uncharacterized protein TM35_000064290 [Trypanosoma theileri]|uniref:PH-like domain-containing protein n=1 Tax=Trypanosoma theileri TaxID=67003 RepID=A0A1X0P3A8_9TRYP|nr:uncharacterized protein TM35_000064290 [Trypanosoma theileri]ORC91424.1 hypothetical protein TM35_000064290 [Trypanosoma theileri]